MPSYQKDSRIDDYICSLPAWQQQVCQKVRDIVHDANEKVIETIKRTNPPYFMLNGNICALLGAKTHVNIFIYDPIAPDPKGIINQGRDNATARAIQVYQDEPLDEVALLDLLKAVIANNQAGGWCKIQNKTSHRDS